MCGGSVPTDGSACPSRARASAYRLNRRSLTTSTTLTHTPRRTSAATFSAKSRRLAGRSLFRKLTNATAATSAPSSPYTRTPASSGSSNSVVSFTVGAWAVNTAVPPPPAFGCPFAPAGRASMAPMSISYSVPSCTLGSAR